MEVHLNVNFKEMTDSELRAYVKEHRSDDEAIRELFVNRRSPDETATWYSFPHNAEGIKQGEEVIRQRVQQSKAKQ
jgi:hypothetical protein